MKSGRLLGFTIVASLVFTSIQLSSCSSGRDGFVTQINVVNGSGLTTLSGSQEYILLPYSAPTSAGIAGSASFNLQLSPNTSSRLPAQRPISRMVRRYPQQFQRMDQRFEGERAQRRSDRQQLAAAQQFFQGMTAAQVQALYGNNAQNAGAQRGGTLNIASPFDGELNDPISGTLLVEGESAAIYLDSRDTPGTLALQAQILLIAFEEISLPRIRELAGVETDVNSDGKIIFFMSSRVTGGVLGFFRLIDLLPNGFSTTTSNEMEILYLAIPSGSSISDLVHATLAHEFCHLANFAEKNRAFFEGSTSGLVVEEVALEEGKAHVMEDLVGWGSGDTYLVAAEFLDNINIASISGDVDPSLRPPSDPTSNDSIARRGGMMLLMRYLIDQSGGIAYGTELAGDISGGGVSFYRRLNTSADIGMANIIRATGRTLDSIMSDWVAALYLDGTGLANSPIFNYGVVQSDPITDNEIGFDLRGSRVVSGSVNVQLNGPAILTTISDNGLTAGSIFFSGVNIIRFTQSSESPISLSYTTLANSSPGLTLIAVP